MVAIPQNKPAGFTLIEVIIVLAISSLLTFALFNTFTNSNRRARFNDSVERLAALIERTRNEANSSYTTGSGSTEGRIFFAKAVIFSAASSSFSIQNLTAANNSDSILAVQNQGAAQSLSLEWGTQVKTLVANRTVIFARLPNNGLPNTYVVNAASAASDALYDNTADNINDLELILMSPDDKLHATLTIDSISGEVKVAYTD